MPKFAKIQSSFSAGQISPSAYGRVDSPRYEAALALCQNYVPTIQGPLIRRPGFKHVAPVKASGGQAPTQKPIIIPFQFSANQNYVLEMGDKYIRFFQNEAQVVTNTTSFSVFGSYGQVQNNAYAALLDPGAYKWGFRFSGVRSSFLPNPGEQIISSSVVAAGTVLELATPYAAQDLANIKFTQKYDTVYLDHPSYLPHKLIRTGVNTWDLKQILTQDGPYLPINSYQSIGDNANVYLQPLPIPGIQSTFLGSSAIFVATGPSFEISNIQQITGGSTTLGVARVSTRLNHTFNNGDKIAIQPMFGAPFNLGADPIQNVNSPSSGQSFLTNSSVSQAYWVVQNVGSSTFDVGPISLQNVYTCSLAASPALFQLVQGSSGVSWADIQVASTQASITGVNLCKLRNIALINNGTRYWGHITAVAAANMAVVYMGQAQQLPNFQSSAFWQLGVYNLINGFPSAVALHQDRLVHAGAPAFPQQFDASMSGLYEVYSASGSNLQVSNNNALQFTLASQDLNQIRWLKSHTQGLLAGTSGAEFSITPSNQASALTPTSINATEVTHYGSGDTDAVQMGTAVLFVQKAKKKIRELSYFWQLGNFKADNVAETSEDLTGPGIAQMVATREPKAVIWMRRTDGLLTSMSYSKSTDQPQATVGWAPQRLGGKSDSAGTTPIVNGLTVIPSSDGTYDQLWAVVTRFINSSAYTSVEYMTKYYTEDVGNQDFAYHLDCGGTYNSSIVVTGISIGSSCIVTSPNHGLANSSVIKFYNTVGLNISTTDINGNTTVTNQLNGNTFVVQSVAVNTFQIYDFKGNAINTNSSSVYVGSSVIRQLVSSVSGLTWLAGETVGVVADGGIHPDVTVTQAGVLNLSFPAAIVSYGYRYNSDAQMLRTHEGSAIGTSIGQTRRCNRVAFMLHHVGDFNVGRNFDRMVPLMFDFADVTPTDNAPGLFSGIHREGVESAYGFTDTICFRQNSGLPGMIQAVTRFVEENDV